MCAVCVVVGGVYIAASLLKIQRVIAKYSGLFGDDGNLLVCALSTASDQVLGSWPLAH